MNENLSTDKPSALGATPVTAPHIALQRHSVLAWLCVFAAVTVLTLIPFQSGYVVRVADSILIYVLLGLGLNIVVGYAGLLDLGYVAFYAVGAYIYALLASP